MADLVTVFGTAISIPVAKEAAQLLQKLLGKPCEVAGDMISDQLYFWQWQNRLRIAAKAQEIIASRQITPSVLPPDFLLPFMRLAGDVEDETLQDYWAQLLCSAIESDSSQSVAYAETLHSLSHLDVSAILDFLAKGELAVWFKDSPVTSDGSEPRVEGLWHRSVARLVSLGLIEWVELDDGGITLSLTIYGLHFVGVVAPNYVDNLADIRHLVIFPWNRPLPHRKQ